jgi:hypothetical protein
MMKTERTNRRCIGFLRSHNPLNEKHGVVAQEERIREYAWRNDLVVVDLVKLNRSAG